MIIYVSNSIHGGFHPPICSRASPASPASLFGKAADRLMSSHWPWPPFLIGSTWPWCHCYTGHPRYIPWKSIKMVSFQYYYPIHILSARQNMKIEVMKAMIEPFERHGKYLKDMDKTTTQPGIAIFSFKVRWLAPAADKSQPSQRTL